MKTTALGVWQIPTNPSPITGKPRFHCRNNIAGEVDEKLEGWNRVGIGNGDGLGG